MGRHEGFALVGGVLWKKRQENCPCKAGTLPWGGENPPPSSGEGAKEERAAGFSYPSKEIRLKPPTFELL